MKNKIGPKIFDMGGNMTGGADPQAIADAMEMGGYWRQDKVQGERQSTRMLHET